MTTVEFLSYLRGLGVRLRVDGDRLRCSAPHGVLTPTLRTELADRKAEIIAFLHRVQDAGHPIFPPIRLVPRKGDPPLSLAQRRLRLPDQLELNAPDYNIPVAVRLAGPLCVTALEESINGVIQRHETLRTTFASVNGQTVQIIAPALALPPLVFGPRDQRLPTVDLRELPETKREAEARRLATEEARQSFDLARGPLLRTTLLQMGTGEYVLLLTMHHIISDDWSIGILVRELAALYHAFSTGKPSPLPDLPIQYADFAVWQREWQQSRVSDAQLAYWKERLGDAPAVLELPTDHSRLPTQAFRGRRQSLVLPSALTGALEALSQQEGCTLFMTLLAAFKLLLHQYTGQTDIVVGTPITSRNRSETEGLIGFFVNTLVLRTDLSGNPTFRELLARVREVTLGAYSHRDLPFERLVEELRPAQDLSRAPLLRIFFNMLNFVPGEIDLRGLKIEPLSALVVGSPAIGAKFDLTLYGIEHKEYLQLDIFYNATLFEKTTIVWLLRHFQTLLEDFVTNPDQRFSAPRKVAMRRKL